MARDGNVAPVIIKRKKIIGGDGHHGGAWKVAYADFVTAMMAFFMLMWLLNATTEKQRKGIADYFSPTIPINRISGGGDGAFGGDSIFSEEVLPQNGTGATQLRPTDARQARGQAGMSPEGAQSDAELKELESALMGHGGEAVIADDLRKHVITRLTDEGLVVELFDMPGAPLFDAGRPTLLLQDLAAVLAELSHLVDNPLALGAHLRSEPVVLMEPALWERSAARADAMRHLLRDAGLAETRIRRVTGHADRSLADPAHPVAERNNRIEVTFLRDPPF